MENSVQEAAAAAKAREKYRADDAWADALSATIRTWREHPRLKKWVQQHGTVDEDTAHRLVVRTWLSEVSPFIDSSIRHRDDRIERLLDCVESYLDDQANSLANTWAATVRSEIWSHLPPSAQWLHRVLHAMAQQTGPAIVLSDRAAIRIIPVLGGPKYQDRSTITQARAQLAARGLITLVRGQCYRKTYKARATQYKINIGSMVPSGLQTIERHWVVDSNGYEALPQFTQSQWEVVQWIFLDMKKMTGEWADKPLPKVDPAMMNLLDI